MKKKMHLHYSQIMNIPCKDNVNNENVRIKVLVATRDYLKHWTLVGVVGWREGAG